MITGTSYFVSRIAAIRYYKPYEGKDVVEVVDDKIAEGAIHIGRPPVKKGQKLWLLDGATRYGIED